jgi:pimeloyl-ACP methyl ester carboxylesterase
VTSLSANRPLASFDGERPAAPAWFIAAISHEPERLFVTVHGVEIETLSWGARGNPGLLLLHGQGAHAHWWSFIAPLLADEFRVTALSWSGMGGSGWRSSYDLDIYADEILEVATHCGLYASSRPPVAAAHSYGGLPLLAAARQHGQRLGGAIIIDSYFRPDNHSIRYEPPPAPRAPRRYPTLNEALARFRLEPDQTCENLYIVDHIARHSLRRVEAATPAAAGWTWRFDPELRSKTRRTAMTPYLAGASCPLVMMAGERSKLMTASARTYMSSIAPAGTPWVLIPDADHHVLLDQPLALIGALRALLALWPLSA